MTNLECLARIGLLLALAAGGCADSRCDGERCADDGETRPLDPGHARMQSQAYRVELSTDALATQTARSRLYRVALSIDPTRLRERR